MPGSSLDPGPIPIPILSMSTAAAHHQLTPSTLGRNLLGLVAGHAPLAHALLLGSSSVVGHALLLGSARVVVAAQILPTHSGSATSHPTAH